MSENTRKNTSRRDFLKNTGRIAATSAVMAGIVPRIYAGENNTIKVVLIGCGGRGRGAASNALSVKNGPMKLVALADVFDSLTSKRHYKEPYPVEIACNIIREEQGKHFDPELVDVFFDNINEII